jgi:hypothetical protein
MLKGKSHHIINKRKQEVPEITLAAIRHYPISSSREKMTSKQ